MRKRILISACAFLLILSVSFTLTGCGRRGGGNNSANRISIENIVGTWHIQGYPEQVLNFTETDDEAAFYDGTVQGHFDGTWSIWTLFIPILMVNLDSVGYGLFIGSLSNNGNRLTLENAVTEIMGEPVSFPDIVLIRVIN